MYINRFIHHQFIFVDVMRGANRSRDEVTCCHHVTETASVSLALRPHSHQGEHRARKLASNMALVLKSSFWATHIRDRSRNSHVGKLTQPREDLCSARHMHHESCDRWRFLTSSTLNALATNRK